MTMQERVVPVSEFRGGPSAQASGYGVAYRAVKMRVDGMGKPPEEVTFEDLWAVSPKGVLVPRDPSRIVQDVTVHNKLLKRGLSHLCSMCLRSKSGVTEGERHLADIDAGTRGRNPFRALIFVGDQTSPTVLDGDARVLWNESDATANAAIPSSVSGAFTPAGYGIRGILLNETTDPLKVVQSRYPDQTYWTQLEYTIFAKANVSAVETGNQGLDNFPIKSIGIAYGIEAGYDDGDSQWASRAIMGLYPTIQAYQWPAREGEDGSKKGTDRPYCHEVYSYGDSTTGTSQKLTLNDYSGDTTTTVGAGGEGLLASNAPSDDPVASYTGSGSDALNATTRQITITTAAFTDEHAERRYTLTITGATTGGNNKDYTIKRRISASIVEVFEDIAATESGQTLTGAVKSRHTGEKAFDGRVENEGKVLPSVTDDGDAPAKIIMGENWRSADTPSGHYLGRVWASSKSIRGIRIICGRGTPREHCPDRFKIQYLDPAANGGNPRPGNDLDWLDIAEHVYTASGPVVNIYNSGQWGYEYHFDSARTTQGIKITDLQNETQDGYVEIQQLLIYEDAASHSIAAPNNVLRLAIDGASTFKAFTIPELGATQDIQDVCDVLNEELLGWQLEAVRSEFGYLLIRATVGGDNSDIELDTNGNGSTINASIGLDPSGRAEEPGVTQPVTKQYDEALTFIVTASYIADLPWAT